MPTIPIASVDSGGGPKRLLIYIVTKNTTMKLTKRAIELEVKTDQESIRELNEINVKFEELTIRLNMVLEQNYDQELLVT